MNHSFFFNFYFSQHVKKKKIFFFCFFLGETLADLGAKFAGFCCILTKQKISHMVYGFIIIIFFF